MKKVSYEGQLWQARQIGDFLIIETCDTKTRLADEIYKGFVSKRVRVTIEELPDPRQKAPGKLKLVMA